MDKYKVKVNPRAIRELDRIYEYIANEKLAPENAKGQVDRIKKANLHFHLSFAAHAGLLNFILYLFIKIIQRP